jgi:hypothetical protein
MGAVSPGSGGTITTKEIRGKFLLLGPCRGTMGIIAGTGKKGKHSTWHYLTATHFWIYSSNRGF